MIQEPTFEAEQSKVYGEVLDTLDQAGISYMIGGALALNTYTGIWRDTKDIDLFVPRDTVGSVLKALEDVGFETEVADPVWLAKGWKGELFADVIHATHNGFGAVDESWFQHARETKILDRRVLVIPAEEMLLSKIFVAAKDRCDVSDVLHTIFVTRGNLDWDRILEKIGEHWELLLAQLHIYRYVYPSHASYLPHRLLERLHERYEKESVPRSEPLRFRGTMLDEEDFDVDVKAWGLPDERADSTGSRRQDKGQA